MPFQIFNPCTTADWDTCLEGNLDASFFHTALWADVLTGAYRYQPVYFGSVEARRLSALLPVMEIDSYLTGKRGVSLPFTDSCPPLAESPQQVNDLVAAVLNHASQHRWRSMEFRTAERLPLPVEPTKVFQHHSLHLEGSVRALKKTIRASTLRNARFAERSGIDVSRSRSVSSMRDFYRLQSMTRKRHGLPPQPWYFFERLQRKIEHDKCGDIFTARYQQRSVAACLFLHFHKRVIYKFGASDGRFHHLRANNLLMWTAIQHYLDRGYQNIDFGRTETSHTGLLQYKRGWSSDESCVYYYCYDTKRKAFQKTLEISPPGHAFMRWLPIPVLRMIGFWLYPHVG